MASIGLIATSEKQSSSGQVCLHYPKPSSRGAQSLSIPRGGPSLDTGSWDPEEAFSWRKGSCGSLHLSRLPSSRAHVEGDWSGKLSPACEPESKCIASLGLFPCIVSSFFHFEGLKTFLPWHGFALTGSPGTPSSVLPWPGHGTKVWDVEFSFYLKVN